MPVSISLVLPTMVGSALAMAYPVPIGQTADPGPDKPSTAETVAIDQDRARRMTVPVSIEGRGPFSFVIDTGAERTVLSRKLAESLELEAEPQARLMSIAGSSTVDMVYVPTLTMGSKSYGGLISPVLLEKNIGAEGMLGLDSLQDQRILFDFARNELNVEDASTARKNASRREIVVTAKRLSGQLIFTEASISGVRVNVIVDTGAQVSIANSTLKNRLLKRARESDDEEMLIAVTGDTVGVEFARARDFRIGRARFANLNLAFADAPPFERFGMRNKPALLLGMDVLRRFDRVAIDFAKRKIHFLPPRSAGTRVERNKHTNTRIKN